MAPPRRGKKAAATAVVETAAAPVESDAEQDNGKPVKVDTKKTKASKIVKPTEQNHEENDEEIAPTETKSKRVAPKRTVKQTNQVEANDENTAPANVKLTKRTAAMKNAKQSEANDADTNNEIAETVNGAPEDTEKPGGKGRKKKAEAPKVVETKTAKGKLAKKAEPQATSKVEKKETKAKSAKKEDTNEVAEKAPETKSKRGAAKKAESPKKPVETERPTSRRGRKPDDSANSAKQEEKNTADENDDTADENNAVDSPKKAKGRGKKVADRAKPSKTMAKENDSVDEDNTTADEMNNASKGRKRMPANAIKSPAKKPKAVDVDVVDGGIGSKGKGSKGKGSPKKRKANTKGPADSTTHDNDTADELVTKRKKPTKAEAKEQPAKSKLNPTATDLSQINFETDKVFNMKIVSWNVAGLRSLVTKDGFDYFEHEKPDIICLQVCYRRISNIFTF